jgi:hypothetical protein
MDEAREMQAKVAAGDQNTIAFNFNYESMSGQEYKGSFQFRVPKTQDMILIGVRTAKHLQQNFAVGQVDPALIPPFITDLAEAVVTIDMLMVREDAPKWALKPLECEDPDAIVHLWRIFVVTKNTFRRAGAKPAPEGGGTSQ